MSRRHKLVGLAAALAGLILVPLTLADRDGSARVTGGAVVHSHARTASRRRSAPRPRPVGMPTSTAVVTVGGALRPVPRSFLGLSIEYWGLPLFEHSRAAFERVLAMLRGGDRGPLILRIGGDSADRSLWDPGLRKLPQWAFRLMPRWLLLTRGLLRGGHIRVILDLNLITGTPLRAAAWAHAAEAALPRGSIAGFEIGNEPDIYDRAYWLAAIARVGQGAEVLPPAISPFTYLRDFTAYARALRRFAPGVPLLGPAVANPRRSLSWISALLRGARPALTSVTAHRYPYSACLGPASSSYPTVARLLAERATAGNAQDVRAAVALAERAGLPFRMTELNSVTCGGRPGVSDTFATALWAPDALFELMRAGVDGVNIHVRADAVNAAMVPDDGRLRMHPLIYGLILFARALGADPVLRAVSVHEAPALHLKAWAVQVHGGALHVLLINKGAKPASVDVRAPAAAGVTVQRLLAASPYAKTGETLSGQTLTAAGTWRGRKVVQTIVPGLAGYAVAVPATSAALVTLR